MFLPQGLYVGQPMSLQIGQQPGSEPRQPDVSTQKKFFNEALFCGELDPKEVIIEVSPKEDYLAGD